MRIPSEPVSPKRPLTNSSGNSEDLQGSNKSSSSNFRTNQGIDQRKFKTGSYEIKDINKANETALKIEEVKTYFSKYQSRSFVLSMIFLFHNKDYNHKKFIRNLSLFPTKLKSCSNKYDYLKNIEEIYNYNQKKKIRLF